MRDPLMPDPDDSSDHTHTGHHPVAQSSGQTPEGLNTVMGFLNGQAQSSRVVVLPGAPPPNDLPQRISINSTCFSFF